MMWTIPHKINFGCSFVVWERREKDLSAYPCHNINLVKNFSHLCATFLLFCLSICGMQTKCSSRKVFLCAKNWKKSLQTSNWERQIKWKSLWIGQFVSVEWRIFIHSTYFFDSWVVYLKMQNFTMLKEKLSHHHHHQHNLRLIHKMRNWKHNTYSYADIRAYETLAINGNT